VSFFHHTVGFDEFYNFKDGTFDDFFEVFMEGACDSGDYFKLLPEWHEQSKQQANIHFVLYEDMKNDIERFVLIGNFVQCRREWFCALFAGFPRGIESIEEVLNCGIGFQGLKNFEFS